MSLQLGSAHLGRPAYILPLSYHVCFHSYICLSCSPPCSANARIVFPIRTVVIYFRNKKLSSLLRSSCRFSRSIVEFDDSVFAARETTASTAELSGAVEAEAAALFPWRPLFALPADADGALGLLVGRSSTIHRE